MLGLGGHLERHDGQGSVDEADAEADEKPADESDPHGDRRREERAHGDRADRHQCATDDGKTASRQRIVDSCLADRTDGPCERAEGDPQGGGCLGPPVHALEDERDHDGETDL